MAYLLRIIVEGEFDATTSASAWTSSSNVSGVEDLADHPELQGALGVEALVAAHERPCA